MRNKLLFTIFLGVLLCASACDRKGERALPEIVSANTQSITTAGQVAGRQEAGSERDEFVNKAQRDIDALNLKLAEVKKRAERATGKAKTQLDRQIVVLEREMKNGEAKLAELKSAIGEKWKELQAGVTAAIEQLKQSIKKTD